MTSKDMLSLPSDWWQRKATTSVLVDWFGRHLLGLYMALDAGDHVQSSVCSGFLVELEGRLYWMTAKHVIEGVKQAVASNASAVRVMRWLDGFQISGAESVPVSNHSLDSFCRSDMDFGVVRIGWLESENIRRAGYAEILSEQIWKNLQNAKPEGYYLIGYPAEWTNQVDEESSTETRISQLRSRIACVPVAKVPYRPDLSITNEFWSDPEAFYGQIVAFPDVGRHDLASVAGMSGGPVFSVERDGNGEIRYWLIGVQRSEYKSEHLIRVEPIDRALGLANS